MYTYRPSSSGHNDCTTPRTRDPLRKYSESAVGSTVNNSFFPKQAVQQSLPSIPSNQPMNCRRALFQLSVLAGTDEDAGNWKSLRVEVVKKILRANGQWEKQMPTVVEHKWEDWVDFREQVVARFPDTEQILPKLAKTSLFSSITSSRKAMLHANCKDLEQLLTALLSCSRSVLDSELVQKMFDTQETCQRHPLPRYDSHNSNPQFSPNEDMDDDPFSKASPPPLRSDTFQHLELFKFPPLAEEEPQLSPTLHSNEDVNKHHVVIPHPYAATKPVGPPEPPSGSRGSIKTSNTHIANQSQSTPRLTRPQTSDCPAQRTSPTYQAGSGSEGAVKEFRRMRPPQALHNPTAEQEPKLGYRNRMGSLPVTPVAYSSNVGTAQPSMVQKFARIRPVPGRPMTSGSTPSLPRTGPSSAHPQSDWSTDSPRHPANVLPSFVPPYPRPFGMDRRLESDDSDTRTIIGTPTQPCPPTPSRNDLLRANTLSSDDRAVNQDSSSMVKHQILRTRSSKEKTDSTRKPDVKSPQGSKAPSPSRLVKQRPGLRQFKSMHDIRSSARGTVPPETIPATPSDLPKPPSGAVCLKRSKSKEVVSKTGGVFLSPEYCASAEHVLNRGRGTRSGSLRQRALPFLDRAGSSLRDRPEADCSGSKDTSPSLSPNRRLHSRQSGSSSNSSFGSISNSHTTSSLAFTSSSLSNASSKQRRSDSTSSTSSLVLSEASATSPLQPITPGQIQSPVNVVINANNTSLLETGGGTTMQYVYDPQKCRFVGQRTIPSAPFFPIPPTPAQKPSSGVGKSFTHDGIRHAVQRRPHTAAGAYSDQVEVSGDLDAPIMLKELKMKKKLAVALAPISTSGSGNFTKVKVTHATSGVNVMIRVPTSIGLAGLKEKVQSKLVDEAEVCLPPRWEFWVPPSGKNGSGQRVCTDSDLGKLLWNGASSSLGKITLKLV